MLFQWVLLLLIVSISCTANAYDDHNARDPFWPLISASGTIISYGEDMAVSEMVLEGIVSDEGGRFIAIVNGNIIAPGDAVGAYKVDRIESRKVVLTKGAEYFELNLKKGGE